MTEGQRLYEMYMGACDEACVGCDSWHKLDERTRQCWEILADMVVIPI